MERIHSFALRGGVALVLGLAIAGCSNKDNMSSGNGGGTTVQQEDQFGTPFATAFRANNNSEPYSPADGDIVAISLTTEPVDIK